MSLDVSTKKKIASFLCGKKSMKKKYCFVCLSFGPDIPHHLPPLCNLHCNFKLYFGHHRCRETSS